MAVAPGLVDIQQMPLYDTNSVAANTATTVPIQFFVAPIGSPFGAGVKSKVQTNMTQAQRLEAPRSFEVHAVCFYYRANIDELDLNALMESYVLSLIVGEKEYQVGPLWFFPPGGGVFQQTSAAAAAGGAVRYNNGFPMVGNRNLLAAPYLVKIEQGENFRVELQGQSFTTQAAGTGLYLQCVLDGVLTRQVQ